MNKIASSAFVDELVKITKYASTRYMKMLSKLGPSDLKRLREGGLVERAGKLNSSELRSLRDRISFRSGNVTKGDAIGNRAVDKLDAGVRTASGRLTRRGGGGYGEGGKAAPVFNYRDRGEVAKIKRQMDRARPDVAATAKSKPGWLNPDPTGQAVQARLDPIRRSSYGRAGAEAATPAAEKMVGRHAAVGSADRYEQSRQGVLGAVRRAFGAI